MRYQKDAIDVWSGEALTTGISTIGRVTVEPYWQLGLTDQGNNWGQSQRGPYRYWQTQADDQTEYEIPNIRNITWDRSLSNDVATATITIMNQWHDQVAAGEVPDDVNILGKPGYFWPGHGLTADAQAEWNQSPATGAYRKDGSFDEGFTWDQVLVPYALLRTYEGYPEPSIGSGFVSSTTSIDDLLTQGIMLTGVWLIDRVTGGSNGELQLQCKDIGKLLLDQIVMPPTIPNEIYPLEYYPDGETRFDSFWEPNPTTNVSAASQSRIRSTWDSTSWSGSVDSSLYDHKPSDSLDLNTDTFSISQGFDTPLDESVYWEYDVLGSDPGDAGRAIEQVAFLPWAGGYTAYLSIYHDGAWWGGVEIPELTNDPGSIGIDYVSKITVPRNLPDGTETEVSFSIPDGYVPGISKFRITLQNLYYGTFDGQTTDRYRAGIREVRPYNTKDVPPLTRGGDVNNPWTFAMAAHPIRGYWVVDNFGNRYGYGDAEGGLPANGGSVSSVYDSGGGFGPQANYAIAMEAHPDGEGYWILYRNGQVRGFGSADTHTNSKGQTGCRTYTNIGPDPWGADIGAVQAMDIAATHTGEGYYIIVGHGTVFGYGDANDVTDRQFNHGTYGELWYYEDGPYGDAVDNFMATVPITILVEDSNPANPLGFTIQNVYTYATCRSGTTMAAHPNKAGFWACNGSGEVRAYGEADWHGSLYNRVFDGGGAGEFRLGLTEFTHALRPNADGDGYWIAFGSGHIAQYGGAVGNGPTDFYEQNPALQLNAGLNTTQKLTIEVFKALIWDLAPDPDGSGFWLLTADGSIGHYEAKFWGQPSFYGMSGVKWFDGNYQDYSDIVKEMLLWAGWLFYDPAEAGEAPVYGSIESTGIPSSARLPADKFDKRTIVDVMNELKQITGYSWWVAAAGDVHYESPNWWSKGNYDTSGGGFAGSRIWTDDITGDQVAPDTGGASVYVPVVTEKNSILNYQASLDGNALRSEILIGNESYDYRDPTGTGVVRHYPSSAYDPIKGSTPSLRNIPKPAMWINKDFTNEEEMELMAELVNLQIWFSQRAGSMQIFAYPGLEINDQIIIQERTTSETFLHYIRGIRSNNDLDSGEYTMDVTTNWLGDEDDWVITADPISNPGFSHIKVSNRVDTWQSGLGLGLPSSLDSENSPDSMQVGETWFQVGGSYVTDVFRNGQVPWLVGKLINFDNVENFTVTVVQASGGNLFNSPVVFDIANKFWSIDNVNAPSQWTDVTPDTTLYYSSELGYQWTLNANTVIEGNYRGPMTIAVRFSGDNVKPVTVIKTAQIID